MIDNISKARYKARAMKLMQERHLDQYQVMQGLMQSESFAALRERVINHYFEQKKLGLVFCVDALVLLVDRVLETMEQDVNASQAA